MKKRCSYSLVLVFLFLMVVNGYGATKEITFMHWGGTWGDSVRKIAEQFEKETGIKVVFNLQESARVGFTKLLAQKDNPQVDVWAANLSSAMMAKEQGLLQGWDEKLIPNMSKYLSKDMAEKNWLMWYTWLGGMYVRSDKVPMKLNDWKDLWDPRLKDQVAVPDPSFTASRFMVLVSVINGGSEENVEPGFKALERLKPNIAVIYKSDIMSIKALQVGEASVCAFGQSPNIYTLLKEDPQKYAFIVPEKPVFTGPDYLMLVKGCKDMESAHKFVNYLLSEKAQEIHCSNIGVFPVNKFAKSPELLRSIKYNPKNVYDIKWDVVNQSVPAWTERWNREIVPR